MTCTLLQDAAGNQGNVVKEDKEGKVSVEEWWGAGEREKQKHSFKRLRKNNVYKAILISTPYITK